MAGKDSILEELSYLLRICFLGCWKEMHHFGHAVNHNHDGVLTASSGWTAGNEVHADARSGVPRHR